MRRRLLNLLTALSLLLCAVVISAWLYSLNRDEPVPPEYGKTSWSYGRGGLHRVACDPWPFPGVPESAIAVIEGVGTGDADYWLVQTDEEALTLTLDLPPTFPAVSWGRTATIRIMTAHFPLPPWLLIAAALPALRTLNSMRGRLTRQMRVAALRWPAVSHIKRIRRI